MLPGKTVQSEEKFYIESCHHCYIITESLLFPNDARMKRAVSVRCNANKANPIGFFFEKASEFFLKFPLVVTDCNDIGLKTFDGIPAPDCGITGYHHIGQLFTLQIFNTFWK